MYNIGMSTNRAEYMREYKEKNRAKINKIKREWARKNRNRQYDREYSKKTYRERSPQKIAVNAVNRAIKLGVLKRKPCEICYDRGHAHHDDYSKPLSVRWLCKKHHQEWHAINGPGKNRDSFLLTDN